MSFDITYYSFNAERADNNWKERGASKITELTKTYSDVTLSDHADELIDAFKNIDLELGGIRNAVFAGAVIIEDPELLVHCITALHETYGLHVESETLEKANILYIYKNLNPEKVTEAAVIFSNEIGFDVEEAKKYIMSFLSELKPVVNDLVETDGSVLYVDYHNSIDGEPKEVEDLLNQRAKEKFDTYKFNVTPTTL